MKRKMNIFDIVLVAYILFHVIYTIYMFTESLTSGLLWAAITTFEILFAYMAFKHSRILVLAMVLILLLQSIASFTILMMGSDSDINDADYALVLGYGLKDNQMQETLKLRMDEAIRYANNNPKTKIVLCGGITGKNKLSEARVMEEYMYKNKVSNQIILEEESKDTIQNIKNSLEYIDRYGKIVVISSDYHVYRAKKICEHLDLDVKGVGAYSPLLLMPNALLHEKLGLIKTALVMD